MDNFLINFLFLIFQINDLMLIFTFLLFLSPFKCTLQEFSKKYIHITNLPSGEFFSISINGIFIFNNDFSNFKQIYKFRGIQIINKNEDENKIKISELEFNNNYYILSLVKNFLYLFDNNKKSIIQEIDLTYNLTGNYYDMNLFNNSNLLCGIVSYIQKISYTSINDIYIFNFYKIDFLNDNSIYISNYSYFNETNFNIYRKSYISDIYLSCQVFSEKLICFYFIEDSTKISVLGFNINNDFKIVKREYNQFCKGEHCIFKKFSYLKSSASIETNNVLLCFYGNVYTQFSGYPAPDYYNRTYCIYYDINSNMFKQIDENYYSECWNFKVYYFKIDKNYFLICNDNKNLFKMTKFDKDFKEIYFKKNDISTCDNTENFFIFYNNLTKKYNLISDCFIKNNNSNILLNIPKFEEKIDYIEYIIYFFEYKEDITIIKEITQKIDIILKTEEQELLTELFSNIKVDNVEIDIKKKLDLNLNITKKQLPNKIPEIKDLIEIGENYKLKGIDFTLIIKALNSSYFENVTHLNFKKCEQILRNYLNISDSRILTIFQIEIDNFNKYSLVNQVEYQIYDDNKTLLNLSLCNETDIQLFFLLNNDTYQISSYNSFKDSGINIFNINDSFFNDICFPYSDSKNDIVLEDRIKDIYQNYSLCDEGCTFKNINLENRFITCDCKVKANLSVEEPSLDIIYFDEIKVESNFGLIKCYNLVFSFNGKCKNIGFWIFLVLVITHIPLLFIYFQKGIKNIKEYIIKEMIKYGYIIEDEKNKKIKGTKIKKRKNKKSNIFKSIMTLLSPLKNINKKGKNNEPSSINNIKLSDREMINQINDNNNSLNINKYEISGNINNNIRSRRVKSKNLKKGMTNHKILKNNVILLKNSKNKKTKNTLVNLPTQGIKNNKNSKKQIIKEKETKMFDFNLININLNNIKKHKPKNSFHILNNYSYEEAIKYDLRSVCAIFYIFLLSKQAICHAFLFKSPLELFPLRFCLLIFILSSDLALNAIFYLDDKISKKYRYIQNLFLFTINNNITIILLSTLIGFVFMTLFINLSNSINQIRDIFRKEEEKIIKDKKYKVTNKRKKEILHEIQRILVKHKIKVICLITIEFLLMLFFWYYVTAFCHVYSSTQISWLLDSLLSMLSRLIIELLLSLGFAKLYRISIEANIRCIYKFVLFFYNFA